MPHVVLAGEIDLVAWAAGFEPRVIRDGGDVLRLCGIFSQSDGRQLLVEALAIEAGRKQSFYIKISAHDGGGATLRIDPATRPERSPGVKRLVAELASDLLARFPGARVENASVVVPSPSA